MYSWFAVELKMGIIARTDDLRFLGIIKDREYNGVYYAWGVKLHHMKFNLKKQLLMGM